MEEARTLVLDLLGQKPRDEEVEATEDVGGHCWVGSGSRGPQASQEGIPGAPTRSRIFLPDLLPISCLLFLPPHPKWKTMNRSVVGRPTKILCQLSSTFWSLLATIWAWGYAKAQVHPCN